MGVYPDEIFVPRSVENRPGVVYAPANLKTLFAEDVNKATDEIVAIQNALGIQPAGDFADVAARLDDKDIISAFRAFSTSTTAFTNNAYTKVFRGGERYDLNDEFNTANSTFTCKRAGLYHFDALLEIASVEWTAGDWIAIYLTKNGSVDSYGLPLRILQTITSNIVAGINVDIPLAVDDYVNLYVYFVRTGGNINQYGYSSRNYWCGHKVG